MPNSKNHQIVYLAGDIGGTKTRLGLFTPGSRRPRAKRVQAFASSDHSNLASIISAFLSTRAVPVAGACFGVAGPVADGRCRTTNLPWSVSEKKISRQFGWPRTRLINDLTATALAVDLLRPAETAAVHAGRRRPQGSRVILAPGTGLGQSFLFTAPDGPVAVSSEGGHVDFSPSCDAEIDLWRFLQRRFGHVSVERVLSGSGLVNIYKWLRQSGRYREPRWLAKRLESGDSAAAVSSAAIDRQTPIAAAALTRFVSVLGAVAGNLALMVNATGGVYLGGGIPPKILPFIQRRDFLTAFCQKGRFQKFLEQIPVRVILNDQAALLGAARCAAESTLRVL